MVSAFFTSVKQKFSFIRTHGEPFFSKYSISLSKCLFGSSILLTFIAALLFIHVNVHSFWWEKLEVTSIEHELGFAFTTILPHSAWSSHQGILSKALILENGKPLGSENDNLHEDIRSKGLGRKSFWHNALYFSSSDNSDPRTNGRKYEIVGPLIINPIVLILVIGFTVINWIFVLSIRETRYKLLYSRYKLLFYGKRSASLIASRMKTLKFSVIVICIVLLVGFFKWIALPHISMSEPGVWKYIFPGLLQIIGMASRDGHTLALIVIYFVLFPAYNRSDRTGALTSLAFTLLLFILPLLALWTSGYSDGNLIGGLLPWSDASGHFWDANRLLEGSTFSHFASRRPLFAGTLATILGLTNHNLQVSLIILVAITAISCFWVAREVKFRYGTIAGVIVLMVLFLFYRVYIGKTLTLNLGLSLGASGLAMVLNGVRQLRMKVIWLGILLITLGLNARAGAFFVLPALILWGTFYFSGKFRFSLRFLVGSTCSVLLGFSLNFIVLKFVGSSEGMAFSNFSTVIYGLVVGNKGWTQVTIDHPEIAVLQEPEYTRRVYELAYETFRSNPMGLVVGVLKSWRDYLNPVKMGAFSFVSPWLGAWTVVITRLVLMVLSGIGLIGGFLRRRDPYNSLILAAALGILLSVPFAPPLDADSMRAYATTIPITAVLAALGIVFVFDRLKIHRIGQVPVSDNTSKIPLFFGIALLFFCTLGPIVTRISSKAPQFEQLTDQPGFKTLYMRFPKGSSVNLVDDSSIPQSYLGTIRLSDFRRSLIYLQSYNDLFHELSDLDGSKTIITGLNLGDPLILGNWNYNYPTWLIIDSKKVPSSPGIFGVYAKPTTNDVLKGYMFFYAESIQSVSEYSR